MFPLLNARLNINKLTPFGNKVFFPPANTPHKHDKFLSDAHLLKIFVSTIKESLLDFNF